MRDFDIDRKIVHHLILRSFYQKDLGLLYGKMGISIFFFEYGRYSNCCVYTDYGNELLEDIVNNMNSQMPINFSIGLAGIGWGIEYLLQNHFVEGCGNEICEEIDLKVEQINLLKIKDMSLDTGLEGLLYYISARMKDSIDHGGKMPFDLDLQNSLSELFDLNYYSTIIQKYPLSFDFLLKKSLYSCSENSYLKDPLGLKNGLSGMLLSKILSNEKSIYNK